MNSNWSYSLETPNLTQILQFFVRCNLEISQMTLKNNRAPFLSYFKFVHHFIAIGKIKLELQSGNTKFVSKLTIFCLVRPWIWQMILKNNRVHLLSYFKLCALFCSHQWIQTGVTVQKRPIQVKISNFLSCASSKFDGWPWKTLGHFFYQTSSFVHHFVTISEFKLELQSGNTQFGSKSAIFCPMWPWNLINNLEKQ